MDINDFWKNILGEVELKIGKPHFATWFKNSKLMNRDQSCVFIGFPSIFIKEWVEKHYHKTIFSLIRSLDPSIKKIDYVIYQASPPSSSNVKESSPSLQNPLMDFKIDQETNLNPRYTLDSFVVGSSNELAYSAATAVIKDVGTKYNPLFLYGGVGVGKTHLIQAVGNEIKKLYGGKNGREGMKVRYVSSEKFTNEVVAAMKAKRMETIKEKYRLIDVLIIDDIQFIGGKARTEEEFFHTFNSLYEQNKQIIISSDRSPKFLPTLQERLRSRFEGGLIADVGYPDYELRLAVLKGKMQEKGEAIDEKILEYIASKIRTNLRELEGILNRVIFHKTVKGELINVKAVEKIIEESVQEPVPYKVSVSDILKTVSDFYNIGVAEITGQSRKKEFIEPRQISIYLTRELLDFSFPYIGEKLGNRDHTTIMYSYEKIIKSLNHNPELNNKILTIKELLTKS